MFDFWGNFKRRGKGKCRRRRKRGFCKFTSMTDTKEQTIMVGEITDETSRKAEEIYELLPKKDCGACGFDSCHQTAIAIARGLAPPDACRVAGKKIKDEVERILNS